MMNLYEIKEFAIKVIFQIAHIKVNPAEFEPGVLISSDTDVLYTAFDDAGNVADCLVKLRIPGKKSL